MCRIQVTVHNEFGIFKFTFFSSCLPHWVGKSILRYSDIGPFNKTVFMIHFLTNTFENRLFCFYCTFSLRAIFEQNVD